MSLSQGRDRLFKGWPAGRSPAAVISETPNLFAAGFLPPVAVLRDSAVEANVTAMAGWAEKSGVLLAPHGKTHMSPQLAARQLSAGAWGITAATVSQARVYQASGVPRILLANELGDAASVRWCAQANGAEGFEVIGYVDSVAGVALAAGALADTALSQPLDVLVEVGHRGGRTGCRHREDMLQVARAVASTSQLRLVGVSGYEGGLPVGPSTIAGSRAAVERFVAEIVAAADAVEKAGLFGSEEIILSAGGSVHFDLVAAGLAAWQGEKRALRVLRSGAYLAHDRGIYQDRTPFGRTVAGQLRPALEVWAAVVSRPEPGLAIVGAGRRDLGFDQGLPTVVRFRPRDAEVVRSVDGPVVERLDDQHAYVPLAGSALEVGDWVALGISHPCTTFDKWPAIALVDDDERVLDCIETFF